MGVFFSIQINFYLQRAILIAIIYDTLAPDTQVQFDIDAEESCCQESLLQFEQELISEILLNQVMKRLEKQLVLVNNMKEQQGVEAKQKQSIYHWEVILTGPAACPFQGAKLILDIDFPEQFPFKFPLLKFRTPLWHPNIKEGLICQQMLGEKQWLPNKKVQQIIQTVLSMLAHPDIGSAINLQAANQYKQGTYFQQAKQHLQKAQAK